MVVHQASYLCRDLPFELNDTQMNDIVVFCYALNSAIYSMANLWKQSAIPNPDKPEKIATKTRRHKE